MMKLADILTPDRVFVNPSAESKKRIFEFISERAASGQEELHPKEIMNLLLARERLGSTAIGYGVALPHARVPHLTQPIAVLLRLKKSIHFEEKDHKTVDTICAVILPETSEDDKHEHGNHENLMILSDIAKRFRRKSFRERLKRAQTNAELYNSATGKEDVH